MLRDNRVGILGKARVTITEILTLNRLPQEIRDECRSSSATARSILLEIARKKQDRAILNPVGPDNLA